MYKKDDLFRITERPIRNSKKVKRTLRPKAAFWFSCEEYPTANFSQTVHLRTMLNKVINAWMDHSHPVLNKRRKSRSK